MKVLPSDEFILKNDDSTVTELTPVCIVFAEISLKYQFTLSCMTPVNTHHNEPAHH